MQGGDSNQRPPCVKGAVSRKADWGIDRQPLRQRFALPPPLTQGRRKTDSHASDIGHWLGMTRRGGGDAAPYKAVSKARRGEGTLPYGVLSVVST